jgi:threonyl-tRNA synthetase
VQVVVAPIVSDANDYAEEVAGLMRARGMVVSTDLRNEKINAKVREHSLAHVPVIAVVGRREAELRQVSLRRLGSDGQQVMALDEAVTLLSAEALPPDLRTAV